MRIVNVLTVYSVVLLSKHSLECRTDVQAEHLTVGNLSLPGPTSTDNAKGGLFNNSATSDPVPSQRERECHHIEYLEVPVRCEHCNPSSQDFL